MNNRIDNFYLVFNKSPPYNCKFLLIIQLTNGGLFMDKFLNKIILGDSLEVLR